MAEQASPRVGRPKHIAVIMDGNGRWASERGKPRLFGHRKGAEALQAVARAAVDYGFETLWVFAFAQKNWKRSAEEVNGLMSLFGRFMKNKKRQFIEDGIRVRFIGNRTDGKLSTENLRKMEELERATAAGTRLTVVIAINYDGVEELDRAAKLYARGEVSCLRDGLDAADLPDPEIVIRTGSVQNAWRDSGFLPLRTAHALKIPSLTLWPDADGELLGIALAAWSREHHLDGGQRAVAAE